MRHGMASHLKALLIQFLELRRIEVAGSPQESRGDVERGVKTELAQQRSGGDQVGFAAVVKCDAHAGSRRIAECLTDTQPAKSGLFEPLHLSPEGVDGKDVADIPGLGLAQLRSEEHT